MADKKSDKIKSALAWKGMKSIEFVILKKIFRGGLVVFMFFYLATNTIGLWRWTKIKWIRAQPLEQMEQVVTQYAMTDPKKIENWFMYRPRSESRALLDRMPAVSAQLPALVFINLAQRAHALGDMAEKNFLIQLARYRFRYDALRCGDPTSVETSQELVQRAYAHAPEFLAPLSMTETIALTRRVIDFDTKYPAENNPQVTCDMLKTLRQWRRENSGIRYAPAPPENWPDIRFNLRFATDISLQNAQNAPAETE